MSRPHDGINATNFGGALMDLDQLIEEINDYAKDLGPVKEIVRDGRDIFLVHEDGTEARLYWFVEPDGPLPYPAAGAWTPVIAWKPAYAWEGQGDVVAVVNAVERTGLRRKPPDVPRHD